MKKMFVIIFFVVAGISNAIAQQTKLDNLWNNFYHIQDSTRTKVWWFHGETETTNEGITADLEAFKKVGIGGVVFYDQVHGSGEHALEAFSKEWWNKFCFAAKEAKRLGLSFETHLSNGYVGGGPWITPNLGMQMLVASDTLVIGGTSFCDSISLPNHYNGYYSDVAVIAFPQPQDGWIKKLILDNKEIDNKVSNGKLITDIDLGKTIVAKSITYQVNGCGKTMTRATNVPGPISNQFYGTGYVKLPYLGELEVSEDGIHYNEVCKLKPYYNANSVCKTLTISFSPVKGRYFRLNIHDWYVDEVTSQKLKLQHIFLSTCPMVDLWQIKSGLISEHILDDDTPQYDESEVIAPKKIINLSAYLDVHGCIRWNVPKGKWVIMRFASVPTGAKTRHGRQNLIGLECDKMSSEAATVQWKNYFGIMSDSLKKHGLQIDGLAMDSHESGAQNWTKGFEKSFYHLRGYDLIPFLPVMAGYIVESSSKSCRVLRDVRRTIADLISDKYYGTLDSLCKNMGVHFTAQAIGNGLCIVGDPIQAKGRVEKPQSEFWAHHPDGNYDIKECSSAAHLYNKLIASGEAFTDAKFSQTLSYLKSLADYAYCYGLNELVVCASAYQPWLDRVPGNTGGGRQYCINRNNTYWNYSKPFWDYQARCSFMMRQGKSINDICVYIGNDAPIKILSFRLPEIPAGIDFDAFTSDALLNRMHAEHNRIVLPDGTSYKMMILPDYIDLSAEEKEIITQFKKNGVLIYNKCPDMKIRPDISLISGNIKDKKIWFAHRRTDYADIYIINNHDSISHNDTLLLNSDYKNAEWWDAVTGTRKALPSYLIGDGRIAITLNLDTHEAGFIILSNIQKQLEQRKFNNNEHCTDIKGDWKISFDKKMGGTNDIRTNKLIDWTLYKDSCIRYYSGDVIYKNIFMVNKINSRQSIMLRIPHLHDVGQVKINGIDVGIIWCSPWQIDITNYVTKGKNTVEISVANSLMNRMIFDSGLPESKRITYAYPMIAKPSDQLISSGITGTVNVVFADK